MLCINCDCDLEIMEVDNFGVITCSCGVKYNKELINDAKEDIQKKIDWDYIRVKRFFKRIDSSIIVFQIGNEFVHPEVYELHHQKLDLAGR